MIIGNRVAQIVWRRRADFSLLAELAFRVEDTWFLVEQEREPARLRAIGPKLELPIPPQRRLMAWLRGVFSRKPEPVEKSGWHDYKLPTDFTSRKVVGLKRGGDVLVEDQLLLELEDRVHISFGFEWNPWDEATYAHLCLCDPNDPEFAADFWTDLGQLPRLPEEELVNLP
jgi:hypothetical protein